MNQPWFHDLQAYVAKKPIVILRLDDDEVEQLRWSGRGITTFTTALHHGAFDRYLAPAVCLVLADVDGVQKAYLAQMGPRRPITTFQSRAKIKEAIAIEPAEPEALIRLLDNATHKRALRTRLPMHGGLSVLSSGLSAHLIERLASVPANAGAIRRLVASLTQTKHLPVNSILQEDAVRTALKAFGLGPDEAAVMLDLKPDCETTLSNVPIIEDSVIEHDARQVPGYRLASSAITGRAVFHSRGERLEVITANRRLLEEAFGVDLIYVNLTRRNMVLLQYKMLNPTRGKITDWIYKPDLQFTKELARMRKFTQLHSPGPNEYRLNPAAFYLKFVKRDGAIQQRGILMPLDHYDRFAKSPAARGPKGGLRVSFEALGGSYLREQPFLDLVRAGYIGSFADTTTNLSALVEGVLKRGRAVVAAIQTSRDSQSITALDADDDLVL